MSEQQSRSARYVAEQAHGGPKEAGPAGHIDSYDRDHARSDVVDEDLDDVLDEDLDEDLDEESNRDPATLCVEIMPFLSMQALDALRLCHRVDGDHNIYSKDPHVDDRYRTPGVSVSIHSGKIGEKEIQIFRDQNGETSVRFLQFEDGSPEDFFDGRREIDWTTQRLAVGAGGFQYLDVLVALLGSGGAGAAIAAALGRFLVRHEHKEIEFYSGGELKLVRGYTASEFDRIIKAIKLGGELSEELYGNPAAELDNETLEAFMRKYDQLMWGDVDSGADNVDQDGDDG